MKVEEHLSQDNSRSVQNAKDLSFRDYLRSELRRGYLLENDEERYTARREKVYTFFKIPREIEKFFVYGFFQCADSFFFVITFLPIRFLLAMWSLMVRLLKRLFRYSHYGRLLKPAEIVDLLKGALMVLCCYMLSHIDTSVCYHIIKTQSTIKLYLFFNMLEIADRLMSAFGQDTLDALFWTATEPRDRKREHFGVIFHFMVAVIYVGIHSTIVLLQALTLNVAINSDNKGLLTIVISNNFVELKGAVFKKFDRNNLLQISCSDVRERFHNCVLLFVVVIQTMKEYSWKEERLWILLPDCALVSFTEVLIDWLKHAFITRFNDIAADAYRDYTVLLASDLVMCKQKYAYSDHSDLVARRMGFIPLPLGVVMFRILSQSLRLTNEAAIILLIVGFLSVLSFRVLNGIVILGKACDLIEAAELRRTRNDSTMSEPPDESKSPVKNFPKNLNNKLQNISFESNGNDIGTMPINETSHLKKQYLEMPMSDLQPSSASTPDTTASLSSQSLGFLGESRSGLMANSMVNLASVGLNQGPLSPILSLTGQDTGPPSPEGGYLHIQKDNCLEHSDHFNYQLKEDFCSNATKYNETEKNTTIKSSKLYCDVKDNDTNIYSVVESPQNVSLSHPIHSSLDVQRIEKVSSEVSEPFDRKETNEHRLKPVLTSCDSLRYRGADDTDII